MEENNMEKDTQEIKNTSSENTDNVGMAVLAYIIFFIPLLTDSKDDPFVKFHVKQSLTIFCSYLILYFLRVFPIINSIFWRIYPLLSFALLVLTVVGIFNAIGKNKKELPLIGQFAEKFFKF